MAYQSSRIVLWDTCPFTLGDEPLAGRVEHSAMELWVSPPEFGIGFDNPVYCQVWKQSASLWQGCIQKVLQLAVQWHFSLCRLRLQLSYGIGLAPNEPTQVPFADDVRRQQPADLP
jgi:hypothetical protein